MKTRFVIPTTVVLVLAASARANADGRAARGRTRES
jgi:hypothetical protein